MKRKSLLITLICLLSIAIIGLVGCNASEGTDGGNMIYIRYSYYEDGSDFVDYYCEGMEYMGIATANEEPLDSQDYTWVKIVGEKGEKGDAGATGSQGSSGNDGVSYYTHVKYAENQNGLNMSSTYSNGKDYIGFAVVNTSVAPSSPSAYNWALFKGEKGDSGTNGKSSSVFIKYSENKDGSDFVSKWKKGACYMGIAVAESEPTQKEDYDWVLFMEPTRKSVKILAIGNSFSIDATMYLHDIFTSEGYEDVIIGNLYIGGCSLKDHRGNITYNQPYYYYFKNVNGTWQLTQQYTVLLALQQEDWDYITLQQASGVSGIASTYTEDNFSSGVSNLNYIIDFINKNKTNPNAKLFWHMTWAYAKNSDHSSFPDYSSNQITMYNAITSAVQSNILSNSNFAGVIPSGTTIQNMRTSVMGDSLHRDNCHLNLDVARFSAALTWYAKITGNSIENYREIKYLPKVNVTGFEDQMNAPTDANMQNINDKLYFIKQSVTNAINTPFAITNCHVNDARYLPLTDADNSFLSGQGKTPSNYKKLNLEWKLHTYYNADRLENTGELVYGQNNQSLWNTTRLFNKKDIPNGSIISLKSGYHYRPEGFVHLGQQNSGRPDTTTTLVVTVDNAWWGSYNFRGFNLGKVDGTAVVASDTSNLVIYVPKTV